MTPQKYPQNLHTPKNINISDPPPPPPQKKKKIFVIQKFKQKNAPFLRMYQTVSEYLPPPLCGPWSLCGCNLAMESQQIYQNANIFSSTRPDAWSYLRFVPFSRSEILETIPSILKSSWLVTPVSTGANWSTLHTMKVILTVRGASW